MPRSKVNFFAVAPDAPTASHLSALLKGEGVTASKIFDGKRDWAGKAIGAVQSSRLAPVVIMVPSQKLGRAQLELASVAKDQSGTVVVWGDREARKRSSGPHWLVARLLEQRGAIIVRSLPVLSELAKILQAFGNNAPGSLAVSARASEIRRRVVDILSQRGISPRSRAAADSLTMRIDPRGKISLTSGKTAIQLGHGDSGTVALALHPGIAPPLFAPSTGSFSSDSIDDEVVRLIAQPPARLLSETTSKRLGAAFGLAMNREHLCRSSSEASRLSAELGNRVILKLVRPGLERKRLAGAVSDPASGTSQIRRAYHSLESLGTSLSPPPALGILAARHVPTGPRIWLKMLDDDAFGRLILGGPGDEPEGETPSLALTADVNTQEAAGAIIRGGIADEPESVAQLALPVARFGRMITSLGQSIKRAEIHPLACAGEEEALVLDMLVAIAD